MILKRSKRKKPNSKKSNLRSKFQRTQFDNLKRKEKKPNLKKQLLLSDLERGESNLRRLKKNLYRKYWTNDLLIGLKKLRKDLSLEFSSYQPTVQHHLFVLDVFYTTTFFLSTFQFSIDVKFRKYPCRNLKYYFIFTSMIGD